MTTSTFRITVFGSGTENFNKNVDPSFADGGENVIVGLLGFREAAKYGGENASKASSVGKGTLVYLCTRLELLPAGITRPS